jgi:hypothetical protein
MTYDRQNDMQNVSNGITVTVHLTNRQYTDVQIERIDNRGAANRLSALDWIETVPGVDHLSGLLFTVISVPSAPCAPTSPLRAARLKA